MKELPEALAALKKYDQWILWRLQDGKKLPIDYRTRRPGDAHNSAVWLSFDAAAMLVSPEYRLGWVITREAKIFCIDCDNCLQPDNTWHPRALKVINALPDAAVEVSQSGRGLHIWGKYAGECPPHSCKNVALVLELYTENRFIALGSGAQGNAGTDCTVALAAVIDKYFPPAAAAPVAAEWTEAPAPGYTGSADDDELIRRALGSTSAAAAFGGQRASFRELWEADPAALGAAYPDPQGARAYDASSADMALCQHLAFWTGKDCARIQRLMERSGLKRDKWQREDYLPRTILRACSLQTDFYTYGAGAAQVGTLVDPMRSGLTVPLPPGDTFYYSKHSRDYLLQNKRGWLILAESPFRQELKNLGFSGSKPKGQELSAVDRAIIRTRHENDVDYAGPLAGYAPGLREMNGFRILITTGPAIPEARAGECNTLNGLFAGLLGDDPAQVMHLYGWLKVAFESLRAGKPRPGQAVAFVGPRNCGKSLAQNIITRILGGRSAKPYLFMAGLTAFNEDLFGAENLLIEDENGSSDIRSRVQFGHSLKQITSCDSQHCHGKFKAPLSLNPFWRLTISLNDEPENLLVLPPIDTTIADKISLFLAKRAEIIPETDGLEARENFWQSLLSEIPAFVDMLLNMEIPPALRSGRFGVTHYHNARVLGELTEQSPEERLRELIERHVLTGDIKQWTGSASDLQQYLMCANRDAAQSLLGKWDRACGTYLGRLARRYPGRYERLPHGGDDSRRWIINGQTGNKLLP